MATTTSMMFTLIPAGGVADPFNASVFLSPRLEGTGPTGLLSDYSLGNFTQTLKNLLTLNPGLPVELFPGGNVLVGMAAAAYVAGLDPILWDTIFPPALTRVTPRVFQDHSKRWIRSYPIQKVEDYIQSLYNQIAEAYPDAFPDLKGNTPVTELILAVERAKPIIDQALPPVRDPKQPKRYAPLPQTGGRATHPDASTENALTSLAQTMNVPHIPLAAFYEAIRFFKRGNQTAYVSAEKPYDPTSFPDHPVEPRFDFHQALAALGDYPYLLRKLGLIIDLDLTGAGPLSLNQQMRILPIGLGTIVNLRPWTRYQLNSTIGLRPEARANGDLDRMMLRLNDSTRYNLIQTDPDGNFIKVYDHAVNMSHFRSLVFEQVQRNPQAKVNQGPEESSLPALRNAGLMVIRHDRDNKLWDTVSRQSGFESSPNNAVLYADDLLRGYRVDVHNGTSWFSLMRRTGDYKVGPTPLTQPVPDEGYIKAESGSSDDVKIPLPMQQPDLYTHGAVVSWTNYSLAAEVPGKTITPQPLPDKHQKDAPALQSNTPGAGFNFSANFKAEKRSLPALRFGTTYKFRARATLLDGSSLAPPPSRQYPVAGAYQAPAGVGETSPITYQRFEPVPAPMLILTAPVREGESMEMLVVRSRGGSGVADALPMGFDETAIFNPQNARWVGAPKAPVSLAEAHGKFDSLFSMPPDTSRNLLAKESGVFNFVKPGLVDPHQATIVKDLGQELDPSLVLPSDWTPSKPLPNSSWYFIRKDDPLPLPYLSDPLARGATFMFVSPPTNLKHFEHMPYDGAGWPDLQPFKLLLKADPVPMAQFMPMGPRQLNVAVPKGEMLKVKYATAVVPPGGNGSALPEGELTLMGRWQQMTAAGRAAAVSNGYQHWMLTPSRTLTLVHAVDKPLADPVIRSLNVSKSAGATFAVLYNGQTALHSPSTGEVELRGHWQDFIDDPAAEGVDGLPHLKDLDGHVLDRKVDYGELPTFPTLVGRDLDRHEFGDTKHRWVRYYLIATTRYREYFSQAFANYETLATLPSGIVKKNKLISVEGPEYVDAGGLALDVLSSARPLAPDVKYIVPTFAWENTSDGRRRLGRGLRIYLGRPWGSSGVDELLGIVMLPAQYSASEEDRDRPYISEWGSDPLFNTSGPMAGLTPQDFDPSVVQASGDNLRLAESPDGESWNVRVVGVTPQFDDVRNLWFADIVMASTSHYYTFVHFSLCRYQPHSVGGLELSRVVRTEFAQLLADRTASFVFGAQDIQITLFGPSALSDTGKHINTLAGRASATQSALDTAAGSAPNQNAGGIAIVIPPISLNPAAGAGHKVVARLEYRALDATGDLGWQRADGPSQLSEVELASNTAIFVGSNVVYWKGSLAWPRVDLAQARQYRIALEEYELWETDQEVGEYLTSAIVPGKWIRSRLVFVEHYPLSTGA